MNGKVLSANSPRLGVSAVKAFFVFFVVN